jgi:hypothetical protein
MMEDVNVSHGKTKMDKMERRRDLPCVRRSRTLYGGRVVHGRVLNVDGRNKKVRKKQRRSKERGLTEKDSL